MTAAADDLISGLRAAGLRITRARREICRVLGAAPGGHLSAADILEQSEVALDTSTVYRTLDALESIGMVSHVHLGHGPGAYHVAPSPRHHHLVCEECGRIVDIPVAELRAAVRGVTEPHGFVADATHFAIVGRCRGCAGPGS